MVAASVLSKYGIIVFTIKSVPNRKKIWLAEGSVSAFPWRVYMRIPDGGQKT
jgi:hypothetical protein